MALLTIWRLIYTDHRKAWQPKTQKKIKPMKKWQKDSKTNRAVGTSQFSAGSSTHFTGFLKSLTAGIVLGLKWTYNKIYIYILTVQWWVNKSGPGSPLNN